MLHPQHLTSDDHPILSLTVTHTYSVSQSVSHSVIQGGQWASLESERRGRPQQQEVVAMVEYIHNLLLLLLLISFLNAYLSLSLFYLYDPFSLSLCFLLQKGTQQKEEEEEEEEEEEDSFS